MEELRPKTILFCAMLSLAIAISALLRGRRSIHWLFAAFATDIACWYATQSFAGFFRAAVWEHATGVLTVLLPQFAIHLFQSVVPSETPSYKTPLARGGALLALPLLGLVLSPYHEKPFTLGAVYTYVFGLLAAALISLALRGRASASRAVRDRVVFLVAVGALAMTFSLADFLSFLGVRLPPIGAVLSTVFLFVLAESMTRPRLAALYELAGRLVVATALAFCLAGIFYLFVMILGGFDTMYLNAVLAAIVFIILFEPLQTEVETRIHQFLFRQRFDLETTAAELRRRLPHVLEVEDLVATVLDGLGRSHRVTSAAIYLHDQDGEGFDLAGMLGAAPPERIDAILARPLLEALSTVPSLSLEELARDDRARHDAILSAASSLGVLSGSVVLSIRGDAEGLVGIMCIADDRVRDAFTPEEVSLLEGVAGLMGISLANSRVYSRMKERDRLAALGSMAAGLAHEVKNPLGAIKGAAQLLDEGYGSAPADPSAREFIGVILEEVHRLDRVVGSFLDYARPNAGNPIPIDINAAVRRTMQILSTQYPDPALEVQLDLSENLPRVSIDPEKLRQVVINIVQNAIQAMDGHGKLTIATSSRVQPPTAWTVSRTNEAGQTSRTGPETWVEISVRDTGPGISAKMLKNLFIPFFTTKTQGTGLGLAISQSIIQKVGGVIDAQSQQGTGTTFTIKLPPAGEGEPKPVGTALPVHA